MMQTSRLIIWVIVGLVVLANLLYWFGPATLRTEELVVIGLLIIGSYLVNSLGNRPAPSRGRPRSRAGVCSAAHELADIGEQHSLIAIDVHF